MGFDKAKAMRNAERFVAQGKIRSAIEEYRTVVEHDPRDVVTLNMLGDLYAKTAEKTDAVSCYLKVADHYNAQGFAQKAIAVYNKISRIQPDSIEVSAKLAELHKIKGSLHEAKSHYSTLADHFQKSGRRLEALSMYKQIAMLDPNNTEVCLNLAESYLREGQRDEAVDAFAEAGNRFTRQGKHEEAIKALMKGYDVRSTDLRILNGLINAQTALGRAQKAASLLEEILENEPYNRDVLYLLIECCLGSQNAEGAERAVIRLVEIEPANYPKFLDLIRLYLNVNDHDSAARILSMSAEYLLAGGQSDECGKWINEILERDPMHLGGLRLLVRYNSWLDNKNSVRLALEKLCASAAAQNSVHDEKFALEQLIVLKPQDGHLRERLTRLNEENGFEDSFDEEKVRSELAPAKPAAPEETQKEWEEPSEEAHEGEIVSGEVVSDEIDAAHVNVVADANPKLSLADEHRIQKELESIAFYIENEYKDLARKALEELIAEHGYRHEFDDVAARLSDDPAAHSVETVQTVHTVQTAATSNGSAPSMGISDIRSEFGIEGGDDVDADGLDYETFYNMGIAYQEMGLLEDAIREFQDAANLAKPHDGTRRFFHSANMLGHCFIAIGRPSHAITWFEKALQTPNITDAEFHGVWYELALAYEAKGEEENAARYFEKIYAENVDFRDVSRRVRSVAVES